MSMNTTNTSKYIAKKEDGKDISSLLESPTDASLIQAFYTRRPDAYESYKNEFGKSCLFAFKENDKLVATCATIQRNLYVGGIVKKGSYICGLKKDPDSKGSLTLGKKIIDSIKESNAEFYYCTVLTKNDSALKKFKKLNSLFSLNLITNYTTYMINPKVRIKCEMNSYIFRQATTNDLDALFEFLNEEGRKKDLFPQINSLDEFYNLKIEDFYLLINDNKIIGCTAIWDISSLKQYTVVKYKGIAKFARFFNPLLFLFGWPRFPKQNTELKFPMLSFLLCQNDGEELYKIILSKVKEEIKKNYDLFCLGLSENHPLTKTIKHLPHVGIDASIYELRFKDQKEDAIQFSGKTATESALL